MERRIVDPQLCDPDPDNPRYMPGPAFNQLVVDMRRNGFIGSVQLVSKPDGRFIIVGGHQRLRAAQVVELKEVPADVFTQEEMDEDRRKLQLVRWNVIQGKIDVAKFTRLVQSLEGKYAKEVLSGMMGFTEQKEFQRLVKDVTKTLPPELAASVRRSQKDLRTVGDLAEVLRTIMAQYGQTAPSSFVFFVYRQKVQLMIEMDHGLQRLFEALAARSRETGEDMAAVVTGLLQASWTAQALVHAQAGAQSEQAGGQTLHHEEAVGAA